MLQTIKLEIAGSWRPMPGEPLIIDARSSVKALLCLSRDSRAEVEAARAAGGKPDPCPKQDHGFMYGRSFEDLDGHVFEPMWMDVDAALAAMGSQQAEPA
jgi:hypothetical protein